jgi:hypothetical protein
MHIHTASQDVAFRVRIRPGLGGLVKPQRRELCRIMDLNFGEFYFYEVG